MEILHISFTEENYIKAIYKLYALTKTAVSTNDISDRLLTQPATVTDMIKRLAKKKLITYKKYYGVLLTAKGEKIALQIIRKHRLWEVFLVDKLEFKWDEVHEIAEQLEHINSAKLIEKLDDFLGNPRTDPHGDVIPDKNGKMKMVDSVSLNKLSKKQSCVFCGVTNHEAKFLQYLNTLKLNLGDHIYISDVNTFDRTYKVKINDKRAKFFSDALASHILVTQVNGK